MPLTARRGRCVLALVLPLACGSGDARSSGRGAASRGVAASRGAQGDARGALQDSARLLSSAARAMILRARAADRADRLDSARAAYLAAAELAPEVRDWLLLRAAGVAPAAATRAGDYSRVTLPVARGRVAWTEAQSLERFRDSAAAIAAYAKLGARLEVLTLRAGMAASTAARDVLRRDLIAFVVSAPGATNVRGAIALFGRIVNVPTATEQLAIARAAYASGLAVQAVAGYSAAFRRGLGGPRDRFAYASALARLNRDAAAAAEFAKITAPRTLASDAAYQRARALVALGRVDAARTLLRDILARYAGDDAAGSALQLLADLASDENRDGAAREAWRTLAERYPRSRFAPGAAFRAALTTLVLGDARAARRELDSVATRYSRTAEATAARYWSARARLAAGDAGGGRAALRALLARDSTSYYAALAARRLDTVPFRLNGTGASLPAVAGVDSAARRVGMLREAGMDAEVRLENARLFRDAASSADRMLATARFFAGTDQASRAIALGRRALRDLPQSPAIYSLVYPVVERETIAASARANGLDPVLVAALIRQESYFNPSATSPVGARGLMQIMPSVGRSLARARGVTWSDALLYDPAVNIRLGTAHLAPLVRRYPSVVRALAAYNAGESRVTRWARKTGADDPELFTELIPFVETRGYVKSILLNREFYRALYSW